MNRIPNMDDDVLEVGTNVSGNAPGLSSLTAAGGAVPEPRAPPMSEETGMSRNSGGLTPASEDAGDVSEDTDWKSKGASADQGKAGGQKEMLRTGMGPALF